MFAEPRLIGGRLTRLALATKLKFVGLPLCDLRGQEKGKVGESERLRERTLIFPSSFWESS
jgi:hypothetical protein